MKKNKIYKNGKEIMDKKINFSENRAKKTGVGKFAYLRPPPLQDRVDLRDMGKQTLFIEFRCFKFGRTSAKL